jgi:hypothetical protein
MAQNLYSLKLIKLILVGLYFIVFFDMMRRRLLWKPQLMRPSPPYLGSSGSSSAEEGVRGVLCPVRISWDPLGSHVFVGVVSGLTLAIYGTHLGRWLLLYLLRSLWP